MSTTFKIREADCFPGQVTSLAHIANVNKIVKEKVTPRQLEMFKRTLFGHFVNKFLQHLITGVDSSVITQEKITDYRMQLACK